MSLKLSPPSCLLCRGASIETVAVLAESDLRLLWRTLGHEFSAEAWASLPPELPIHFYRCRHCEFEFFDPTLCGSAAFYEELENAQYYSPDRPEFLRAVQLAKNHDLKLVLDIGCGSGAFLDLAHQTGLKTFGLELNAAAARKAQAKGHKIFLSPLPDLNPELMECPFDLITLFQVLEHVAEPVDLVKQAARLLQPGGFLVVAVPSAHGILRVSSLDPHQWPPHHVSRWRRQNFPQLAQLTGLVFCESHSDLLLGKAIQDNFALQSRLTIALHRRRSLLGLLPLEPMSFLYRKMGLKYVFPRWGHSIYAVFQSVSR